MSSKKSIAKNSIALYVRMAISIAIGFYTSRVILNVLGIDDFGLYGVLGSIVGFCAFLNSSMATSVQRFLTIEVGKGDIEGQCRVFKASRYIHNGLALSILFIAEVVGCIFIENYLNVSESKIFAAHWTYQASLLAMFCTIVSVPYNACIISFEKMKAFAYISIFESVLRLIIVLVLPLVVCDKLIAFAVLSVIVSIIVRLVYFYYIKKRFPFLFTKLPFDKKMAQKIISFSGWNLFGVIAAMLKSSGTDLLLNIYAGLPINAAKSIASRIDSVISGFSQNLFVAINPQITKNYAKGDEQESFNLATLGARYAFYMLLIIILPLMFETEYVLRLWLKIVPEYAVIFTQLTFLYLLLDSITCTLLTIVQAKGQIAKYQLYVGGILLLNFPVSWLFLEYGYSPEVVYVVSIGLLMISDCVRYLLIKRLVNLSLRLFFQKVVLNVFLVALSALVIPLILAYGINTDIHPLFMMMCCILSTITAVFWVGMEREEKNLIINKLRLLLKNNG